MKRNMKIMISALSVMLIMALAVTVLSFSLAGDESNELQQRTNFEGAGADTNTNIDNIIENSYATYTDADPVYKIVEIGSGAASLGFDKFVSSKDFENFVINGNTTLVNKLMNADKITYSYFQASTVTDESEAALAAVSNADFIYVSNDPSSEYSAANDMGEKLYDILHTYAVGDYKPLIIDKSSAVGGSSPVIGGDVDKYSMSALASYEYGLYGKYYYTFAWTNPGADDSTALKFFQRDNSLYLGIRGNKVSGNWSQVSVGKGTPTTEASTEETTTEEVVEPSTPTDATPGDATPSDATPTDPVLPPATEEPTTEASTESTTEEEVQTYMMSEILIISDGTDYTMSNKIMSDFGDKVENLIDEAGNPVVGDVYDIRGNSSALYTNGYNADYVRPGYTRVTKVTLADIASETFSLDGYDMIIIEEGCAKIPSSEETYNKLAAAMYARTSITYSAAMASIQVDQPDDSKKDDVVNQQASNYAELFYMVATLEGQVKYENIMIPNNGQLDIIMSSKSASTCKVIADLINASAFRGIGGPKSSSSKFTVLEIQPCYPIDEDVAAYLGTQDGTKRDQRIISSMNGSATLDDPSSKFGAGGNYYTVPSNVINGRTKEELNENTEYYAWELSKAKLAAAYNLTVDQINLVQVSTEELASMKEDIFGNYDLIYVGGNTTALKQPQEYRSYINLLGSGGVIGDYVKDGLNTLKKLPIYAMYTHSGEPIKIYLNPMSQGGTAVGQIPTAAVEINGQKKTNVFTLANGNDITYNKLQQLKEYVKSGMPVVFSKDATEAYQAVKDFGYEQNSIDPDCNMYKFMSFCGATTTAGVAVNDNVLWNFDQTAVVDSDNNGGDYGETQTGFVSIFAETQAGELQAIYTNSDKRPKLTLTNMPATYNMYDKSSYISSKTLNFAYKVSGSTNYEIELYVDDNGNSVFESGERVTTASATEKANGTLAFKVADSFYGPLYWKLVVKDKSGLEANTSGICYVADGKETRQKIRILQIMPGQTGTPGGFADVKGEGSEGQNSLYFCPICQQSYQRLEFNPSCNAGARDGFNAMYSSNYRDQANGISFQGGNYLGLHEHEFGIVTYDSNKEMQYNNKQYYGADDWDANLADEVQDRFDFDIDIMVRSEFVDMAYAIEAAYDLENMSEADKTALLSVNPFKEGTADYSEFHSATDAEKLPMVYEARRDTAKQEFDNLKGLVSKTEKEFNEAFADYKYVKELKAEIPEYSEAHKPLLNYSVSATDAEIDLRNGIRELRDAITTDTSSYIYSELTRLLETRHYWDFYAIYFNGTDSWFSYGHNNSQYDNKVGDVKKLYQDWVSLKDEQIEYEREYKKYDYYVNQDEWLTECFDMVVIGAANDFSGDDFVKTGTKEPATVALAHLKGYIEDRGNTLMFHDTLTAFEDAGAAYLTQAIRDVVGMDRYHMDIDETASDDMSSSYYVPYKTVSKRGSDVYFMTDLSVNHYTDNAPAGYNKYSDWLTDTNSILNHNPVSQYYLSSVAYSDSVAVLDNMTDMSRLTLPYLYGETQWSTVAYYMNNMRTYITQIEKGEFGSNRASQVNKGIVTLYPFTLSDELNISATHAQTYALDIEDTDLTVWYALAGGTGYKAGSSMFAASPRDGMDSYFIYTYKNFNYCGAGHSDVTGMLKDNNDERRLYINIICNSVRKSVVEPDIFVYDYNDVTNKVFVEVGDEYVTKVSTPDLYPEFSFLVRLDEEAEIDKVKVYYDLDYLTTTELDKDACGEIQYVTKKINGVDTQVPECKNPNHVLITNDWDADNMPINTIRNLGRYDADLIPSEETEINEAGETTLASKLKLKSQYFDPYNGQYTYIVIEVTDTLGNTTYKRIKIQLKDKLFNLT